MSCFFPSLSIQSEKHCKWQKWTRILRAGTKANMYERNNRHIKMVAKLSIQPKEKEVSLVRVSTKFNKTGVEWKATLPFMPLVVALATKISYDSQNYYHDCPFHYLATLSQFLNCLSVPFPSVFAGPDFICDNQSRLPCESFGLLSSMLWVFFKSRLLFLWDLNITLYFVQKYHEKDN